jgi:hypothetical protein
MNEKMTGFILSLFVPFRWIIRKMGADYDQFICLLKLKLIQDSRRQSNTQGLGGSMSKQIFVQVLFGFIFALIVSSAKFPAFFVYFFILSMSMVIMGLTFIAEFTTILFDTSENAIIQPLPVKGNTISLARNTHIALYLASMAIFLTFPTFVIALFKFGIVSGVLFLFTVLLNAIFTLFLANIVYLGIMKFANAEKLKNIVMYFQILVTIFIGGMQLGSSLITKNFFISQSLILNGSSIFKFITYH